MSFNPLDIFRVVSPANNPLQNALTPPKPQQALGTGSALSAMWGAQDSAVAAQPMQFGPAAPGRLTVGDAARRAKAAQGSVGAQQGPMPDGTTLDKSLTLMNDKPVTGGKTAMDQHGQAIMDRLGTYDQRIADAQKKIEAIANPYDPNGDTFKRVLAGNRDIVTRAMGGDEGRMRAQLAAQGMAAGGQGLAAMFDTTMARRARIADMETGMYSDALTNGAKWDMDKANTLANLAGGNLAAGESALSRLLSASTGNYQFDRTQDFSEKMGMSADGRAERAQVFNEGVVLKTLDRDEKWRGLDYDLKTKALDLAQRNRLDDRQAEMWGNIVGAVGPSVIDAAVEFGIPAVIGYLTGTGPVGFGVSKSAIDFLKGKFSEKDRANVKGITAPYANYVG